VFKELGNYARTAIFAANAAGSTGSKPNLALA
jgi:hypothetical protein